MPRRVSGAGLSITVIAREKLLRAPLSRFSGPPHHPY
jgi:hypothetical protein